MSPRGHLTLLVQAVAVWFGFWLLGLPDYYQQYAPGLLGVGCVLLTVGISYAAVLVLHRTRPEIRASRAFWLSLYYTVPFAALDTLYCGIHLGRGHHYLVEYWYLSVFYVTPWLTFPPIARVLGARPAAEGRAPPPHP